MIKKTGISAPEWTVLRGFFLCIVLLLLFFTGAGCSAGQKTGSGGTSGNAVQRPQVVVYYFHRTVRCPTCTMIEKLTVAAVEEGFRKELEDGTLQLKVLNMDEEPNRHFENDYRLEFQSVVVSQQSGGNEKQWKNLEKIWDYVGDSELFSNYIIGEVKKML